METKAYTTIDRAALGWPSGEWDSEPDKVQWPDEATGLPCLAVRHPRLGNWCGYVGVPPRHPWAGHPYSDVDVEVHGGLTFANACQARETEAEGICHVPGPGEPEHVYWFGFDCSHAGDSAPSEPEYLRDFGTYRTLAYVKGECASLAVQLAAEYPQHPNARLGNLDYLYPERIARELKAAEEARSAPQIRYSAPTSSGQS